MRCEETLRLLMAYRAGALVEDEEERVSRHLETCAGCRELGRELGESLGSLEAPPIDPPQDFWKKAMKASKPITPPIVAADLPVRVELRCSYCRDEVEYHKDEDEGIVHCALCLSRYHKDCYEEHGRCGVMGCQGTRILLPKASGRPRTRRRSLRWGGLALAVAGAAGGLGYAFDAFVNQDPVVETSVVQVVTDDPRPRARPAKAKPSDPFGFKAVTPADRARWTGLLGFDLDHDEATSAFGFSIKDVRRGGPGEYPFELGDRLSSINEVKLGSYEDVIATLQKLEPGASVTAEVWKARDSGYVLESCTMTLGLLPRGMLGVYLTEDGGEFKAESILPESGAEKAGLRKGDRISSIAGRPLRSLKELGQFLKGQTVGKRVEIVVKRDGDWQRVLVVTLTGAPRPKMQGPRKRTRSK